MLPVKLKVIENKNLFVEWDDKTDSSISLRKMRELCPCATCISERDSRKKTYIPLFLSNQLLLESIEVVGNYAIQVKWKDGHNTGIYEFPFLKSLEAESTQDVIK